MSFSLKRPDPHPPLTVDTWIKYWESEYNLNTDMLTGHTDATEQLTDELEQIKNTSETFDQLQSKLAIFLKNRRDFLKDVDDKWCSDHPEKWGFPHRPH